MVGTEEARVESREEYYTPQTVALWLESWAALTGLAEQIGSIKIHLTPASSRHLHTDMHRWPVIQADIGSAWNALGPRSTGYKLIYLVQQGYEVITAGDLLRLNRGAACGIYWQSVREMARFLGWRAADE